MVCSKIACHVYARLAGFSTVTYRFASTIVPHYQGQRPIKLHDMLIIRAEGPDALDQHLQHIETRIMATMQ